MKLKQTYREEIPTNWYMRSHSDEKRTLMFLVLRTIAFGSPGEM